MNVFDLKYRVKLPTFQRLMQVCLGCLVISLSVACSSPKTELKGNWKINDLVFYDQDESQISLAALLWLNILSEDTELRFHKDSIFVNHHFQSTYTVKEQVIHYQDKGGEIRSLDYLFYHDTLILRSRENQLLIKLVAKD